MRLVAAMLLVTASFTLAPLPTAQACHPDPSIDLVDVAGPGSAPSYYVVREAYYGGCPHELTLCIQVWRESNNQPGLQRTGSNPDHAVFVVCPFP